MRRDGREARIPCGHGRWEKGRAAFDGGPLARFPDEPVAGSFAWRDDDTCVIRICAYETPFTVDLELKLAGDDLILDAQVNVAFGPTKRPQLTGRAK